MVFRKNKLQKFRRQRGFLVLEILIAGLILTASIAVTMYMFRLGYGYLEKTRQSNVLSSNLIQAAGLFKVIDLDRKSGKEEMGNGVTLNWEARLLKSSRPSYIGDDGLVSHSQHEFRLYRVNLTMNYQGMIRDYQLDVFKNKPLLSVENMLF